MPDQCPCAPARREHAVSCGGGEELNQPRIPHGVQLGEKELRVPDLGELLGLGLGLGLE